MDYIKGLPLAPPYEVSCFSKAELPLYHAKYVLYFCSDRRLFVFAAFDPSSGSNRFLSDL